MKVFDMTQGSTEWYQVRLGIPTASRFGEIVTPKGKLSASARKYVFWLAAEKMLNRSLQSLDGLEWVERGRELEPQAVRGYEFEFECTTRPVGFITTDDGRMGCSPDRLIDGVSAGVEVKCPAPQTMVRYLIDGFGDDYKPQVQGQILIGEFEYVDRYAWSPEMPPVRVRTYRDEAYLAILKPALDEFCDMLDEMLEKVRSAGLFAERARLLTPIEEYEQLMKDGS